MNNEKNNQQRLFSAEFAFAENVCKLCNTDWLDSWMKVRIFTPFSSSLLRNCGA